MLEPLLSARGSKWREKIKLVASDMDGTMTRDGRFSSELIAALHRLRLHKIKIILITGRSAGWVSGLAALLPIDGAIAENGGVFFEASETATPVELTPLPHGITAHRDELRNMFSELRIEFPDISEAPDNRFRLTDWTYSVHGLTSDELGKMALLCAERGFDFTFSNVQCHILPKGQNKANALMHLLTKFPVFSFKPEEIVTIGDSPNDESMFDSGRFPNSIGVANLRKYAANMRHVPRWLTEDEECAGFVEMVEALLESRTDLILDQP